MKFPTTNFRTKHKANASALVATLVKPVDGVPAAPTTAPTAAGGGC